MTPVDANVSFSGTIFQWPLQTRTKPGRETYTYPVTINKPDELKSEKELAKEEEERKRKEAEENAAAKTKEKSDIDEDLENKKEDDKKEEIFEYYLPVLDYTPSVATVTQGLTYKIGYTASASMVNQTAYSSANLYKSDDFDWTKKRSEMYTIKTPVSLTSTLNYAGNFFTVQNGISYSPVYQSHPYISEDTTHYKNGTIGYTEESAKTLRLSDYKAEKQDILNTNTVTIKPFAYLDVISDSSISWNSTLKLYRREFTGTADNPEWENKTVDWDDKESITANSLSAVLSAKEFSNKLGQTLTMTAVMPPQLKQYTATLGLTFPYVSASFSTGIVENDTSSSSAAKNGEVKEWKKNPFNQSLSVSLPLLSKSLSFSESYSYNREDDNPESLRFSTSWYGLSLSYVMSYTYGYDFNSGWKVRPEKEFLPYSLSFSYSTPSKTFYNWYNRIQTAPALSTSIVADLLRPTNSYFLFTPSLSFKVTDFMTLTFSATTRNSVLYWYFHNNEGDMYSDWGGFPGNILKDLTDSFRFDNQSVRESSGFKIKSMDMTLTHDLHDWKFNMTLKFSPRVITENGKKLYDFSPYISLGVVWNPMDSMKTNIIDEYGEWHIE